MKRMNVEKKKVLVAGLRDAADMIRKRGLCIGALTDADGRVCLMGAIRDTFQGETRAMRYLAYDQVNKALRRPMHEWNDEQTDAEKVATLLVKVASDVEQNS